MGLLWCLGGVAAAAAAVVVAFVWSLVGRLMAARGVADVPVVVERDAHQDLGGQRVHHIVDYYGDVGGCGRGCCCSTPSFLVLFDMFEAGAVGALVGELSGP